MKKLLIILLFISSVAQAQINPFSFSGTGVWALDFDGSTEYLSCTPALRLTGEYSLVDNFSDGNYDGWTVSSGAYSVVDSVPLSGGTKSLKCTSDGIISVLFSQVYGQWEFDWYKGADNNYARMLILTATSNYAGSGYTIDFTNTEEILFGTRIGASTAPILRTSASYFTHSTWYRIKITRNTDGQFYLYIKGGAFGSNYILVSTTDGLGTNPITNNTVTSSNYMVMEFQAKDMISNISCIQGEGSLDLNSYERIYHSDNRNFTKTGGFAWADGGTHTIDTSSTDKRTGTYSGKLISTDVGDSTTNFVSLPAVNFDTLKQDANSVYEKYTLEFWVKSKALSRVIVKVGNQVKTSDTISTIAFEKVVFNFQSNAIVSNQPILLYLNQADTVYLDDVSLTKSYDILINSFAKHTANANQDYLFARGGNTSAVNGYNSYINTSNNFLTAISGGTTQTTETNSATIGLTNYYLQSSFYNRIGNQVNYVNGVTSTGTALTNMGKIINTATFYLGTLSGTGTDNWAGTIGHFRIIKFTDIAQSNVSAVNLVSAYNLGKLVTGTWTGGSPIEVGFWDWKGADITEILRDKSGTGNNLTGTNITIDDRIKVKGKFK